jgi:hypothetical protein
VTEYHYKTADLAAEFGITAKTLRKKAQRLGLGIDLEGRAGFRYSETDRQRLIESLRPEIPTAPRRKRRRVA